MILTCPADPIVFFTFILNHPHAPIIIYHLHATTNPKPQSLRHSLMP